MPLRVIVLVLPLVELLEMVIVPLAAPATVGSKLTCRFTDCPGFSVTGTVAPVIVNPVPARVTEFTVSAAVPEEVNVNVLVDVVFRLTVPKSRLLALTVN